MNLSPPTAEQIEAISARGNVLVVAGAGAGKTRTLVDRCLAWLLEESNQASIDEVLMVTFTQAAATEMRRRLRVALESAPLPSARLAEQLALLETAHISTLHSFCFQLVSEHFYELGLDPQLRVLSNEESHLLARQTLDSILQEIYDSESPADLALQQFIISQAGDRDQPVRDLIRRLHEYAQTLPDPAGWFAAQRARFQCPQPDEWRKWLLEQLESWRCAWLEALSRQPSNNTNAQNCAASLAQLSATPTRADFTAALAAILDADKQWPRPKSPWRDPIKDIFSEAEFLYSVCLEKDTDPLAEDWEWVRPSMLSLLEAAARFGEAFRQAKRQEGALDYHDLEQFALRLLKNSDQPGAIAEKWRKRFRLVFVDEFQDINAVQAAIIQALARDGADANLFLVGDVKQSIYRFRLADPGIFLRYREKWAAAPGTARVLTLSENFRSHEGILNFVNALFAALMRAEAGGVDYTGDAHLRFGAPARRPALAVQPNSSPPVELLLRCRGGVMEAEEPDAVLENASENEKEARMVGRRLGELHGTPIPDEAGPRPLQWRDMVILLRSPRYKVEGFVKEFQRLGIPLLAARGGFYDSLEARDLRAVLDLLDNPLQDLPLLAVLRSPFGGFSSTELASIRAAHPRGRFWHALADWHRDSLKQGNADEATLRAKAGHFLARFRDWRRQARQSAVAQCLESILDQTHYTPWLLSQERGPQRCANVERFLQLARQFDDSRRESLSRFLRFLEAQQESEIEVEPPPAPETDAVRLMSIHQSKGQEFPVVVVADLGKKFNLADLRERVILDDQYGLCPQIKPPGASQFYPSLPCWLAWRRQKRDSLGEEMRLLYVAMTRAARRLILAGCVSRKALEERWPNRTSPTLETREILAATDYLGWIGPWLAASHALNESGADDLLTWKIQRADPPADPAPTETLPEEPLDLSPETINRIAWTYPFAAETNQPAKASVSALRRRVSEEEDLARSLTFTFAASAPASDNGDLSASEIGSAHHAFLEAMSLRPSPSASDLKQEAARLARDGILTLAQIACLDFAALANFWCSALGTQLLEHSACIQRELAFTARFDSATLTSLGAREFAAVGSAEFVIVQGVIDLVVILPAEIWLLDFKTDHFQSLELTEKINLYRPQLDLYAQAISQIQGRPVTRRWLHFLSHRQTVAL